MHVDIDEVFPQGTRIEFLLLHYFRLAAPLYLWYFYLEIFT